MKPKPVLILTVLIHWLFYGIPTLTGLFYAEANFLLLKLYGFELQFISNYDLLVQSFMVSSIHIKH